MRWLPELQGKRPSILLIDEIESHLHPHWQRRILPGLRAALPDTQIIVTTHSPFVASSCPDAKLHVLERNGSEPARVRPAMDSPFGQDLLSTIDGVFGIESRFDVKTERELDEWHQLKKRQNQLSPEESTRLAALARKLGERSEDLRAIVGPPRRITPEVITSLVSATSRKRRKG